MPETRSDRAVARAVPLSPVPAHSSNRSANSKSEDLVSSSSKTATKKLRKGKGKAANNGSMDTTTGLADQLEHDTIDAGPFTRPPSVPRPQGSTAPSLATTTKPTAPTSQKAINQQLRLKAEAHRQAMREKHGRDWGEKEYARVQEEDRKLEKRLRQAGKPTRINYSDDYALRQCLGLEPQDMEAEASTAAQLQRIPPPAAGKKRVVKAAKGAKGTYKQTSLATEDHAPIQGRCSASPGDAEGQLIPVKKTTAGPTTPVVESRTQIPVPIHSNAAAIADVAKGKTPATKPTPGKITRAVTRKRKMERREMEPEQAATSSQGVATSPEDSNSKNSTTASSTQPQKIFLKLRMNAGKSMTPPVADNSTMQSPPIIHMRKRPTVDGHANIEEAPKRKKQRIVSKPMPAHPAPTCTPQHQAQAENTSASTSLAANTKSSTSKNAGNGPTGEKLDLTKSKSANWPSMVQYELETITTDDQPAVMTTFTNMAKRKTKTTKTKGKTTKTTKTITTSTTTTVAGAPNPASVLPQGPSRLPPKEPETSTAPNTSIPLPQQPARQQPQSPKTPEKQQKKKKQLQAPTSEDLKARAAFQEVLNNVPRIKWAGDEATLWWTQPEQKRKRPAQAPTSEKSKTRTVFGDTQSKVSSVQSASDEGPQRKKQKQAADSENSDTRAAFDATQDKVPSVQLAGDESQQKKTRAVFEPTQSKLPSVQSAGGETEKRKKQKRAATSDDLKEYAACEAALRTVPRIPWAGDQATLWWTLPEKKRK